MGYIHNEIITDERRERQTDRESSAEHS